MSLGLKLRQGRPPKQPLPSPLHMRTLESDEVVAHGQTRDGGLTLTPLQRLTSRHRQMARMIAAGATVNEVAMAMGFTTTRVWQLKQDPTFVELIAHYQLEIDAKFVGFAESLGGLAEDAVEELRERLEVEPSGFDNNELMAITRMGADRTGHGPSRSENLNVNVNFGDRLEEARRRARAAPTLEEIPEDIEFLEVEVKKVAGV